MPWLIRSISVCYWKGKDKLSFPGYIIGMYILLVYKTIKHMYFIVSTEVYKYIIYIL